VSNSTSSAIALLAGALLSVSPAAFSAEQFNIQSDPTIMAAKSLGERKGAAAVGVWRDGAASYGKAAHTDGLAADPMFEIGSISKVFTGLLLAQAVERGDLKLDDNLGKLLQGEVKLNADVGAITLRQLVTHSACLPRMPDNFSDPGMSNPYTNYDRTMLWSALANLKLPHAAPCAGAYSNMGFAVVGELLARRYSKPWEQLVADNITGPLGMHDTMQHLNDKAARLAPAYNGAQSTPPWDFIAFAGAGSLHSTPADMLVFSRAILAGKKGPLGAAVPRMLEPLGRIDGAEIGYGIMMRGPQDKRTYFHTGGTGGFRSDWLVMPDTQQALVVMVSNAEAPAGLVGGDIVAQRYPLADTRIAVDDAALPKYTGVYRVDANMAMTFVAQDGKLYGRITGQTFTPLTAAARDVFTIPQYGAEFSFQREGGKIAGATLRQRGGEFKGRRTGDAVSPLAQDPKVTQEAFGGDYVVADASLPPMNFDVHTLDGQLLIRLNDQPLLPVFAVPGKADRYACDVVAAEFQFERDAGGKPSALVLHQNGAAIRALRKPTALKLDGVALYLRGSMNDWGLRDQLQAVAPGVYTATVKLEKGDYQFKVASEDWKTVDLGGSESKPLAAGAAATLARAGENINLSVASPSTYTFKVDASGGQPRMSVSVQ
jgi:CubicO group peptidase (beta-lactamase class C family)